MGRGYISNGPVTRFRFVGSVLPSARFLVVVSIYFHLCECKPGERKALDLSAYALENLNYRKSFSHLLYFLIICVAGVGIQNSWRVAHVSRPRIDGFCTQRG
jgi:hypothetical protein